MPFDTSGSQYKYEYGIDSDIEKTKTFEDFVKEDEKLKKEYDNLNCYYNFALKSLKYFIPKLGQGLKDNQNLDDIESDLHNLDNLDNLDNTHLPQEDKDVSAPQDGFETAVVRKTNQKINDLFMNSVNSSLL